MCIRDSIWSAPAGLRFKRQPFGSWAAVASLLSISQKTRKRTGESVGFFTLLLLAFGLSMDAFAVAVSDALCYPKMKRGWSLAIALSFGFFQALMPAIGYFAGSAFSRVLSIWDNWIAFLLLAGIGAKMIWEAVQEIRHPEQELCRFFNLRLLLMQSVATSIDALAVGMGFAILEMELFSCVAVIGIVTFLCCLGGILLGKRFGSLFRTKAEIAGGIILLLIGVKLLLG